MTILLTTLFALLFLVLDFASLVAGLLLFLAFPVGFIPAVVGVSALRLAIHSTNDTKN